MSITTRATTWRYLTDPDCALVMVRLVREVAGIAHAAGVTLTNEDTLLPLQGILSGSENAGVSAVMQAGREFQRNAPNHRLSSLQDLEAGRPLEIDGWQRAKITALACSQAPAGYERWTLRLLADKAVELGYCEHISHTEVSTILKKTISSPI